MANYKSNKYVSNVTAEDITLEMIEAVAQCLVYREEYEPYLKEVCPRDWRPQDLDKAYNLILADERLDQVKETVKALEKKTLIDDDKDTLMLVYNSLLMDAKRNGKFDVVARILKEIRQLKQLDKDDTVFEVVIKVKHPEGSPWNKEEKGNI